MPSKNKKQLNLLKLVKSYVDNGLEGLFDEWNDIFPKRKITQKEIEKIKIISNNIKYEDLEDFVSGIEGDDVLGLNNDVKVGYWVKFNAYYENSEGRKVTNPLIVRVTQVLPSLKLAKFNPQEVYNRNGVKTNPVKSPKYDITERMWLDYIMFDQIIEVSKDKKDLIMKNEMKKRNELYEIRKVIRGYFDDFLNEAEKQDTGGLKIQKRGSDEMVSVKTGMLVQKKSDESKGKVLNVGIDDSIPAKNNIHIEWYYGDLSGTKQTLYPEDIMAI